MALDHGVEVEVYDIALNAERTVLFNGLLEIYATVGQGLCRLLTRQSRGTLEARQTQFNKDR